MENTTILHLERRNIHRSQTRLLTPHLNKENTPTNGRPATTPPHRISAMAHTFTNNPAYRTHGRPVLSKLHCDSEEFRASERRRLMWIGKFHEHFDQYVRLCERRYVVLLLQWAVWKAPRERVCGELYTVDFSAAAFRALLVSMRRGGALGIDRDWQDGTHRGVDKLDLMLGEMLLWWSETGQSGGFVADYKAEEEKRSVVGMFAWALLVAKQGPKDRKMRTYVEDWKYRWRAVLLLHTNGEIADCMVGGEEWKAGIMAYMRETFFLSPGMNLFDAEIALPYVEAEVMKWYMYGYQNFQNR